MVPEILDGLSVEDERAIRSRKELRLINRLMGNWRWIAGELTASPWRDRTILELGAGDGAMACKFLSSETRYRGMDRAARPSAFPAHWGWEQGDVLGGRLEGELLVANLFLHHLSDEELGRLGAAVSAETVALFFCEPYRHRVHRWQGMLLYPFGLSEVTRHDMQVSIRAGFRFGELAALLGLDSRDWQIVEKRSFLGGLRFRAVRISMEGSATS